MPQPITAQPNFSGAGKNLLPLELNVGILLWSALALLWPVLPLSAADLQTWPRQYLIDPWETNRLTTADVVGPDGIVYPNWTSVGMEGGIPSGFASVLNPASPPSGYAVFDVQNGYGAAGDGVSNDDDEVAAALAAALAWNNGTTQRAILYFPTGSYVLTKPLTVNEDGVVVAGAGKEITTIKLSKAATSVSDALFQFDGGTWGGTYLYAASDTPRGASQMTFTVNPATSGYAVGSWVRIVASDASAGDTMRERYSNPGTGCLYADPMWHFGRVFIAKITAINGNTATFDRTFPHDFFLDEAPQMRTTTIRQWCGLQDLAIDTQAADVELEPFRHRRTANSWVRAVRVIKAKDWPLGITSESRVRFEVRDCDFDGTWADISSGSRAYLGWGQADTDCLMDNCTGDTLRHMGIFQMASRCVVRACTFTGDTVQSPQLHGRFPLENLVEQCVFGPWSPQRGKTVYGIDAAASTIHGPNGPRNVYYNNDTLNGSGTAHLHGTTEGFIFAYNRIRTAGTDAQTDAMPPIWSYDRTFDTIVRGNIFDALPTSPVINLEDPTCTGWRVADNLIYNSNGILMAGPASVAVNDFNRFRTGAMPVSGAPVTAPEAPSIYLWQRTNATLSRILVTTDRRAVSESGGTSTVRVIRVNASTATPLTVSLSASPSGAVNLPASVIIPAGEVMATVTLTGQSVAAETVVTLTATASGLGLNTDTETVTVIDSATAPNLGIERPVTIVAGLPAGWESADLAKAGGGSVSYSSGTWTLTGKGPRMETSMGTLGRSGRRFVWKTIAGDGSITARLASYSGVGDAGLMVCDDIAPITEFMAVMPNRSPLSSGNVNDRHAGIIAYGTSPGASAPVWLQITRTGSVFTASTSSDGVNWTQRANVDFYQWVGDGYNVPEYRPRAVLDPVMHFGMFVNSDSTTTTRTVTFSDVVVSGAEGGPSLINTLTLTSSLNPSTQGDAVTFTATVLTNGMTAGDATGTVTFMDGEVALGSGAVNSGVATVNTSTLAPGSHSITAIYAGDAQYSGSVSSPLTQTVNGPGSSLIIYEPFNYAIGSNNPDPDGGLNGGNGLPATNVGGSPTGTSTGWRGNWGTSLDVVSGLSYSQGNKVLTVSGGAGLVTNATWGTGTLNPYRFMTTDPFISYRTGGANNGSFGADGTTLYFSMLMHLNDNFNSTTVARIGIGAAETSGNIYVGANLGDNDPTPNWGISRGSTGTHSHSAVLATAGSTALLVGRYTFGPSDVDTVELWVNPALGGTLGVADASLSGGNFAITGFGTRPDTTNVFVLDEFRMGLSFADVTPFTTSLPTTPIPLTYGSSNGWLTLSWPSNYTGWELQSQTNELSAGLGTNWSPVVGSTGTNQ
nr:Ig-like domain repeat protein [Verrucomicrobiota bacterium]